MARPQKKGLDYFPLDTNFFADRKIQRLAQKYGCKGICTYQVVLCEIYRENGYYVPYDNDFCFDIGFTLGLDETTVREIILFCVRIRLFDSELLESYHVLSSAGIQRRFREVNKRCWTGIRPELEIKDTDITQTVPDPSQDVSATETGVNVTETPVIVTKTPTKEKENKLNKTTQNGKSDENEFSDDNGYSARRAELLRMAKDATRG